MKVVDSGVPTVMMGNVFGQSVIGEETTLYLLSSKAVAYMRNTLKFEGILMTDELSDTALSSTYSQDEAAVTAVKVSMNMMYVSIGFEGNYNDVGRILMIKGV